MLNRRAVRFALLVSGVLGVFVVVLLIQEQSIFGKRRRYSPPAEPSASASTSSPVSGGAGKADGSSSNLSVQGVRIVAMGTHKDTGEKVKAYAIRIGETIGAVEKRTHARNVEVQIYNKKSAGEERVVAIVKGDDATITFVDPPDVAKGFSGAEIESLELRDNVVVDYLNEAGEHAAKLTTDELQLASGGASFYVPRRAIIDQEGTHIEGDGLRYSKSSGAFSFEKNVVVEGSSFKLPTAADSAATDAPGALRRITCVGPFTYVPAQDAGEPASASEQPMIKSGVLTFKDSVVGTQEATRLDCDVLELTLGESETADAASDGGSDTKIKKVVATGARQRPARLVDAQGAFIAEVLSMEKTELGDVIVLKTDARIENAKFGSATADTTAAAPGQSPDLLNAAAKTLIRVEPLAPESPDAPERMKILLRDAAFLAIESATPEKSFRIDGEEIDVFVVKAPDEAGGADKMQLERLSARLRARGVFSKGTFTADDITVRPKEGAADPSDSEIELKPNPRIDLTMPGEGGADTKVVVTGTDCVAVIQPPAQDGGPIEARFKGKNTLTVDENGERTLTMDAMRSLTIVAPGAGKGETTVTAVGEVTFASHQKDVHGNGETVVLRILEDDSKQVSILAADAGPLARVTLIDENRVGNEIRGRRIDFDPKTNVLDARGSVHAVMPAKMLGATDANASAKPKDGPATPGTLDCEHLVVHLPVKDKATGATPKTLVMEATERARYVDPDQGIVATGHRLVFDQATGLATAYGNEDEPALILHSVDDATVKVQDQIGVGGSVVIMDRAAETLVCPDRGSVVIVQPLDAQDEASPLRTTRARSTGPVKYMNQKLVLRQNVSVTFEQDGIEDRVLHCDKLTVTFKSGDEADPSSESDLTSSVKGVDKLLAEGRVLFEQSGARALRAGGDIAEWIPTEGNNWIELRAPSPLCWAETEGPGPDDFGRYDGTSVRIRLDTQELTTGPGVFDMKTPRQKKK